MNQFKRLSTFGNTKLPKTTLIFNMGPATSCPSKALGLCKVASSCYALAPECNYRKRVVLPYRSNQMDYWLNTPTNKMIADIDDMLSRRRVPTKLFRFNESGDFHSQACVGKLSRISRHLMDKHNIITYGYSARSDLNFKGAHFLCKGSGHDKGNNGRTIVIDKHAPTPTGFFRCPGDCHECNVCTSGANIAFPKH